MRVCPRALLSAVFLSVTVRGAAVLVDTHVHLTNISRFDYPWLASAPASFNRTWTLDDYARASASSVIPSQKIVFIEVHVKDGEWLEEVKYIQSIADAPSPPGHPTIGAIVGSAPVEQGAINTTAWLKQMVAAAPLLRGIRRAVPGSASNAEPCDYVHNAFLDGVRSLAAYDLHFELLIQDEPEALACAYLLAAAAPAVNMIVNHMGSPNIAGGGNSTQWLQSMQLLATQPNVVVKFSGMPTEAGPGWNTTTLLPYFGAVVQSFGPERVLFGGNWFVVTQDATYSTWASATRTMLDTLTKDAQEAILGKNALQFYKIDV